MYIVIRVSVLRNFVLRIFYLEAMKEKMPKMRLCIFFGTRLDALMLVILN
jgi:hypothetical protein